jgi:uncharacterized YigZ family protein
MNEIYSSIQQETSAQIKIEGSRFIADVFPVENEESSRTAIEAVRKEHYDATHHCFAYVIGADNGIFRYSDDGEPSGTAGIKIYNAIQSQKLSDILIVVTRYFGGTKLGVGGLGRAYFESATAGLAHAKIISKAVMREVTVLFPFSETNPVMNVINTRKLKIVRTEYLDNRSLLTLNLLPSQLSSIESLVKNSTRGAAEIRHGALTTVVLQ